MIGMCSRVNGSEEINRASRDNTLEMYSIKGDGGKGCLAEEDAKSREVFFFFCSH